MKLNYYHLLIAIIVLLGLILRLNNYYLTPPLFEVDDEIHYAWAGLTWLNEGTPRSWSWLESYQNPATVNIWGRNWRMVSPMLEKPPLYIILNGILLKIAGINALDQVNLQIIRLLPLLLSLLTLILLYLVTKEIFSQKTALIALVIYSVTPTIVLANRLNVTENLFTPLSLFMLFLMLVKSKSQGWKKFKPYVLGMVVGLAFLTKQIGIVALVPLIFCYIKLEENYAALGKTLIVSLGLMLLFPIIGLIYDWDLFLRLGSETRRIGLQGGLPQLIFTILGHPLVTTEKLFPDGTILLGLLLLFTSPLWFFGQGTQKELHLRKLFLLFPLSYLAFLFLTLTGAEPVGSGQAFWGWYMYPLFPYLIILLAYVLVNLWYDFSFYIGMILVLVLGSSSVRFLFLLMPREFHYRWQHSLGFIFLVMSSLIIITNVKFRKAILLLLFFIYIIISIITVVNLRYVYPPLPQPL